MGYNSLLEEKTSILKEVLRLTNTYEKVPDEDANANNYISLFNMREDMFERIYELDEESQETYNKKLTSPEVKELSNKIIEKDKKIKAGLSTTIKHIQKNLKEVNQTKKIQSHFHPDYHLGEGTTFDSQG